MTALDRRALLASGAALLAPAALGHSALAQPRPSQDLPPYPGGDIALLKAAYGALHPGLLRYQTQGGSDARFVALERAFGAAKDRRARYLALSRFLTTVRCGHSYANFYNQAKPVQAELFEARDRLPFQFRWLGPRMVVTADPAHLGLAPGTEVTAIHGRPVAQVLAALMRVARADGHNDGKRRMQMSVLGQDGYESFDVFFPLLFGSHDRYRLDLRAPGGRVSVRTLEAIDLPARRAQRPPKIDDSGDTAQWTYERRGDSAVMTMPGWGLYNSKWDWKGWIDDRFEEMARTAVTSLVIDIRGNEGGLDCGDRVVAHLIDAPITRDAARRLVRYRKAPAALHPYLDTWDRSFEDWGADAHPFNARYFMLDDRDRDGSDQNAIKPLAPRFRGKVAVLIDPQNSSATYQFASAMRRERLGLLVGEETGGNQRGINGGAFFFLRLPESGLEVDLPLIGQFPPELRPDRGVPPDIAAPQTVETLATGRDAAMERAVALLRT